MAEFDQIPLLQRFEPILRFTHGERFFPYHVDDYVKEASLWVKKPKKLPERMVSEDDLNLDTLGSLHLEGAQNIHYLHFISPMNIGDLAEFRINELREAVKKQGFQPSRSRLARVGYIARIVDVIFSLVLLLRGRVPGDAMAAAVVTFNKMLSEKRTFKYYGRVIRQNGWIILQYWYFYPFNNWRTGFFGANDHEADWEMVNIYCYRDDDGSVKPAWAGYACHNFSGEELRRNWDDPQLEKVGHHPVVYVGGGSHASYFQKGEYLTKISLSFLKPLRKVISRIDKMLAALFQEKPTLGDEEGDESNLFAIPFVDYALGDGISIGPGCEETWDTPEVIEPAPAWVKKFRGLWGYYAQDPFSSEDAPAGPRYDRDGTVRRAWFDPIGWADMEKILPPNQQMAMIADRKKNIEGQIKRLKSEITRLQNEIYQRGIELSAIQDAAHLQEEVRAISETLRLEEDLLAEKRRRLTVKEATMESLDFNENEISDRDQQSEKSQIRYAHHPQIKRKLRFSRLAEIWAAVSIGLMMIAVVFLIAFARRFLVVGLAGMLLVMITIESAFRRRLYALVRWMAIVLAIGSFLILLFEFFWVFILVIVMVTGFYMIVENLRELFARQ